MKKAHRRPVRRRQSLRWILLKEKIMIACDHHFVRVGKGCIAKCGSAIENIRNALVEADPVHTSLYRNNSEQYIAKLISLRNRMKTELAKIPNLQREFLI